MLLSFKLKAGMIPKWKSRELCKALLNRSRARLFSSDNPEVSSKCSKEEKASRREMSLILTKQTRHQYPRTLVSMLIKTKTAHSKESSLMRLIYKPLSKLLNCKRRNLVSKINLFMILKTNWCWACKPIIVLSSNSKNQVQARIFSRRLTFPSYKSQRVSGIKSMNIKWQEWNPNDLIFKRRMLFFKRLSRTLRLN